jgi:polyhydroxybutyrate depolymerase
MKLFLKWLALTLVLVIAGLVLTASWYLRWDELPPPEMPGVVEGGVLEHNGLKRNWIAYVPAAIEPAPSLVMVLHGSTSDGAMARTGTYYSFDVLAERNGFVVLYPDGFDSHWNDCRAEASYQANLRNIDDVGFLRALVVEMSERYGVDPERVFATGLSNGGHMVYRLAYEAPDLIAGGAAVIANLPVPENLGCEPSGQAVPMLVLNGTEDPVTPYNGGQIDLFGETSRGVVMSSEASAKYWAELAGYTGDGSRRSLPVTNTEDDTSLEILDWSGPGQSPVRLVSVVGGGHTFPNPVYSAPRILGPSSHQADGAELIWDFFREL